LRKLQHDAAAAAQASATTLEDRNSEIRAFKKQKETDSKRIENLSQRNTSLTCEASNTQAAQFEAALEKPCANLHNMQLIVLLNNIRNVVVKIKSPELTSHSDCKEACTGR
jgi:hypothetical protein